MSEELAAIVVGTGVRMADRIAVAQGMFGRMRGLLRRPQLKQGEGLLLAPCNGIHTVGMAYPIDVVFLDRQDRVRRVAHAVRPGRFIPYVRGAARAIELPAGTLRRAGVEQGDELWLISAAMLLPLCGRVLQPVPVTAQLTTR